MMSLGIIIIMFICLLIQNVRLSKVSNLNKIYKNRLSQTIELGDKGTFRILINGDPHSLPIIFTNIDNEKIQIQLKFDRDKISKDYPFTEPIIQNKMDFIESSWYDIKDTKLKINLKEVNFNLSEANAETLTTFIKIAELNKAVENKVLKRLKIK